MGQPVHNTHRAPVPAVAAHPYGADMESCLQSWVPVLVQVIGGAVTAYGLIRTWREFATVENSAALRAWERIRGQRQAAHTTAPAGAALAMTWNVDARMQVRPNAADVDANVAALWHELDDLRAGVDKVHTDAQAAVADAKAAAAADTAAVHVAVDILARDLVQRTDRVALGGLGTAGIGVVIGMAGTVLSLWSC